MTDAGAGPIFAVIGRRDGRMQIRMRWSGDEFGWRKIDPSLVRTSEELLDMPMRDRSAGPALVLGETPADDGMNAHISDPRNGRRTAEFRNDGGGWFASHGHIFDNRTASVKSACSIIVHDSDYLGVRKSRMDANPYLAWLIENLKAPGKSQAGLARHLGIPANYVNKTVNGTRRLRTDEIAPAAAYFGVEPPNPELAQTSGVVMAPVVGRVEAGAFREVDELEDDYERIEIAVPRDDKFPNARILVFDVGGDSMNKLTPRPIFSGDRVVAVAYEDVAHVMPMRDGMVAVVERSSGSGHMREWSVKQLEIYEDRFEFHPRSSNPKHKPIVVRRDLEADDGVKVEVIGLVRRVINDIPLS